VKAKTGLGEETGYLPYMAAVIPADNKTVLVKLAQTERDTDAIADACFKQGAPLP
jgi:hypothetical protein